MADYWAEYQEWKSRAERAERLLADNLTPQEVGRAHHIKGLEAKVAELRRQVTFMREAAERHNRDMAATKLVVYCTGACPNSVPDREYVTEEVVAAAEVAVRRLRAWLETDKRRRERVRVQEASSGQPFGQPPSGDATSD